MKKLNFKLIIAIIVIAVILLSIAVVILAKKKPTQQTTVTQTTATVRPLQPVDYPADKPATANNKIYFISKNQLRTYDLKTQKDGIFDFPAHEDVFNIGSIIALAGKNDSVVLRLDNLNDDVKQFGVFDIPNEKITTKFVDKLKAVAWQGDQQKLLGYALSSTNEPYFLTSSLDAKDQKAIIKTLDTDVTPLLLTDKALVYVTGQKLKKIDLEAKQESTLVDGVTQAKVTNDGAAVAYTTAKGLFALTKTGLQTISVSQTLPDFFNWSDKYLMFGKKTTTTVPINRWDSVTKQLLTRATITLSDTITSVEAAFEDTTNKQIIYWADGFLYNQKLP